MNFSLDVSKEVDVAGFAEVQSLPGVLAYGVLPLMRWHKAEVLALRVHR